jgi:ubiquinone/menaquinone biosynthesis C-methylase UbiE
MAKSTKGSLPPVLDATCGSRMMWFDKSNDLALFCDCRREFLELCDGRALEVNPDILADFRGLPFEDESFHLVVFDPPHISKLGANSWMAQKYGKLLPTWETDIKGGFEECWRVLKPNGTLIFKWSEREVTVKTVLELLDRRPLFGHPSGKSGKTLWMTFFKSGGEQHG